MNQNIVSILVVTSLLAMAAPVSAADDTDAAFVYGGASASVSCGASASSKAAAGGVQPSVDGWARAGTSYSWYSGNSLVGQQYGFAFAPGPSSTGSSAYAHAETALYYVSAYCRVYPSDASDGELPYGVDVGGLEAVGLPQAMGFQCVADPSAEARSITGVVATDVVGNVFLLSEEAGVPVAYAGTMTADAVSQVALGLTATNVPVTVDFTSDACSVLVGS